MVAAPGRVATDELMLDGRSPGMRLSAQSLGEQHEPCNGEEHAEGHTHLQHTAGRDPGLGWSGFKKGHLQDIPRALRGRYGIDALAPITS